MSQSLSEQSSMAPLSPVPESSSTGYKSRQSRYTKNRGGGSESVQQAGQSEDADQADDPRLLV
jgi:hypothetical protein